MSADRISARVVVSSPRLSLHSDLQLRMLLLRLELLQPSIRHACHTCRRGKVLVHLVVATVPADT